MDRACIVGPCKLGDPWVGTKLGELVGGAGSVAEGRCNSGVERGNAGAGTGGSENLQSRLCEGGVADVFDGAGGDVERARSGIRRRRRLRQAAADERRGAEERDTNTGDTDRQHGRRGARGRARTTGGEGTTSNYFSDVAGAHEEGESTVEPAGAHRW